MNATSHETDRYRLHRERHRRLEQMDRAILEAVETGAGMEVYLERWNAADAYAKKFSNGVNRLSLEDQILGAAILHGHEGIANHIFPFWESGATAISSIFVAIRKDRIDWLSKMSDAQPHLFGRLESSRVLYRAVLREGSRDALAFLMNHCPHRALTCELPALFDAKDTPEQAEKLAWVIQSGVPLMDLESENVALVAAIRSGNYALAEQLWDQEPLTDEPEMRAFVMRALDWVVFDDQPTWLSRLTALLPPEKAFGLGWKAYLSAVEAGQSSECLIALAACLDGLALRKVWVACLADEKWAELDRLASVVPLAWSEALVTMGGPMDSTLAGCLPQTVARLRQHHLEDQTAPTARPRRRV